jgi:hypothetical protein
VLLLFEGNRRGYEVEGSGAEALGEDDFTPLLYV